MAENIFDFPLSGLRLEFHVNLLIDFLNTKLGNYGPVKRGFYCSDTSIQHPYLPYDGLSIPVLPYMVILPLLIIVLHPIIMNRVLSRPRGHDSNYQRPHPLGVMIGAPLTALLTAYIKLAVGRLAPNFYRGCKPGVKTWNLPWKSWQASCNLDKITDEYITDYDCFHPERLGELSRSFPCLYTSLSSFSCSYLAIWVYKLTAPSLTRAVVVLIHLAPLIFVGYNRLRDYRSHLSDVIAGWMLGVFIAVMVSEIGSKTSWWCKSDQKGEGDRDDDEEEEDEEEEDTNQSKGMVKTNVPMEDPRIRVCSSALLANIESFVDELRFRFGDVADDVVHVQLPYNDLDGFSLNGWNKNDVIILCHSIRNRRLSLTNVTDALYQKFIPKASELCGKDSLIVIAHDFKWSRDETKYRIDMESTLRLRQRTTFKCAGNVFLAGELGEKETYDGLRGEDWDSIEDVISNWSNQRRNL